MKKLLCVILAMLLLVPAALADEPVISVTGDAIMLVPADTATIRLGVRVTSTDVLKAQSQMNDSIDSIRQALAGFGLDGASVNTDWISIYTNYDYSENGDSAPSSYTASSTLSIVTKAIDDAGKIIDIAFASGANTLDGITFSVSDIEPYTDELYVEAMKNARAKASVLAGAESLTLGRVASITQGNSYAYDSMSNVLRAEATDVSGAGTFVQSAMIQINASVSVAYELKDAE